MGRFQCHKCHAKPVSTASAYPLCLDCYATLDAGTQEGAIALAFYEAYRANDECFDGTCDTFMDILRPHVPWEKT